MAKVAKPKKREPSLHSRAARRNASPPSKDTLTSKTSKTTSETDYKPWLHSAQNAGINKKTKPKHETHAQRMRREKALEKADANSARLEKKVGDSKRRSRKVQDRAREWEEVNGVGGGRKVEKGKKGESGDVKAMEGVEMPDLEQPLAMRSAEDGAVEEAVSQAVEPEVDEVI